MSVWDGASLGEGQGHHPALPRRECDREGDPDRDRFIPVQGRRELDRASDLQRSFIQGLVAGGFVQLRFLQL